MADPARPSSTVPAAAVTYWHYGHPKSGPTGYSLSVYHPDLSADDRRVLDAWSNNVGLFGLWALLGSATLIIPALIGLGGFGPVPGRGWWLTASAVGAVNVVAALVARQRGRVPQRAVLATFTATHPGTPTKRAVVVRGPVLGEARYLTDRLEELPAAAAMALHRRLWDALGTGLTVGDLIALRALANPTPERPLTAPTAHPFRTWLARALRA